jgi:uncharacterized alpha-E superfamily protein
LWSTCRGRRAARSIDGLFGKGRLIERSCPYLRLIDDYARRSLDAQREWLDAVQEELERQQ